MTVFSLARPTACISIEQEAVISFAGSRPGHIDGRSVPFAVSHLLHKEAANSAEHRAEWRSITFGRRKMIS
jgi:hypothetical protein